MSADSPRPRRRIILDCDPGHDDAVAIVVAAHRAELCGIVTVAGNAPIERTTHNALVMRDLLKLDTPVHRGAARPLVAEPRHAAFIHGASGLDGAELPAPTTPLDGDHGAEFIVETCRSLDDVWLVPVGPLTNIAHALQIDRGLADRVAGISLMGGGTFGNRSAVAEFNIWADPEAAAIVFDAAAVHQVPLTMAGLDVTHRFQATPERIERVRRIPGQLAAVLADLFAFFSASYVERHAPGALRGAALHDPLAVLAVTDPQLFERRRHHVVVETAGDVTRGMTVIDTRRLREMPDANCDVLVDLDDDAAFEIVLDAIRSGSVR